MKFDTILSKAGYLPDTSNQVWARPDYTGIAYSDGDEIENRIGAIIANAADLSVFSIELAAGVTDWASLYHLSSNRANILRPFTEALADQSVLEIGAGCGAITRFLGECGAQVLALEGTARRAAIARSRTRDLSNVTVLADRFEDVSLPLRFDVVTLIGVLEYAPLFTKGEDPPLHMLLRARDLLKPGGKLIVAIENQLGLKYLAGFPEDHVGVPMYGIEGRYRRKEVTTFGRKTLGAILKRAGFAHQSFMAPFPDYKFPLSIVTEQGFACESFDAGALAWQTANRDPQKPGHLVFAPELAWPVVAANGLTLDLANSFLVLAQTAQQPVCGPAVLAYHYSTANRHAAYCKQTVFQASSDGGIEVRYASLCRETRRKSGKKVQFDLANRADYVVGTSLAFEFITILSRSGWTMDELGQCLRRYLRIVESLSAAEGVPLSIESTTTMLPGTNFDIVPQNILIDAKGHWHVIDREWRLKSPFPSGWLIFRALLLLLNALTRFAPPASTFRNSRAGFMEAVFHAAGFATDREQLEEYGEMERAVQSEISGVTPRQGATPRRDWWAPTRPLNFQLIHDTLKEREQQLAFLHQEITKRDTVLEKLKKILDKPRNFFTQQTIDDLRATIEETTGNHGEGGKVTGKITTRTECANREQYHLWLEAHRLQQSDLDFYRESLEQEADLPVFHLVSIVKRGEEELLADTIDSIGRQLFPNWKFSVLADFACPDTMFEELEPLRWVHSAEESVKPLQELISLVDADWVGLLPSGTVLEPTFLFHTHRHLRDRQKVHAIYFDSDERDGDNSSCNPRFRPDFNLDLLLSTDYLGEVCLFRKDEGTNQMLSSRPHARNFGAALSIYERFGDGAIGHLAFPLYHVMPRTDQGETQETADDRRSILAEYFARISQRVDIAPGFTDNSFFLTYRHEGEPLVSILIPTKNNAALLERCITSLLNKTSYRNYEILVIDNQSTDPSTLAYLETIGVSRPNLRVVKYPRPFNFSAMNNQVAGEARGEYLLLLNDDTEIIQDTWLERMLQHARRADVGAVGARLVYSNKTLQHAGVVLGLSDWADHPGLGQDMLARGYMDRFQVVQNFSAVTAACLLVAREKYLQVGGMDEDRLKVLFNDVDLCLKLGQAGYRNVWTPFATVVHHGSSSLGAKKTAEQVRQANQRAATERLTLKERWLPLLANDPCYNRNLSLRNRNWQLDTTFMAPWQAGDRDRLRVAGLSSISSGSTYYRMIAPLTALRKKGLIWETVLPDAKQNPVATFPRIIELERLQPDTLLIHSVIPQDDSLKQYKQFTKTCRIFSLDDLLTETPRYNPAQKTIPRDITALLKRTLQFCDRLIVSTEPLREFFRKKNLVDEVVLIPNSIDPTLWTEFVPVKRQGSKPRVGWAGALQHHGDLRCLLDVVRDTAATVDWVFLGMCPEELRPYIREFHPFVPLADYPAKLAGLHLDLAVAPLEANSFNEAKSNLRLLEYGVLGIPVVASNVYPYRDSPAKLVENTSSAWTEAIRERIHDPDATEREGQALEQWVRTHFLLDRHLPAWFAALMPS